MNVVIIADDLTGAADCGAGFATQGFGTCVVWGRDSLDTAGTPEGVLVLDANSRGLSEVAASRVVVEYWRKLTRDSNGSRLYKKIDSTLRGHWAAEVASLRRAGAGMAILAPAFPQTGRTTRGGCQYLHGALLPASHELSTNTLRGGEIGTPLSIRRLRATHLSLQAIRDDPDKIAAYLTDAARENVDAVICDAEITADLANIAEASITCRETSFLVGSAGLAQEWARQLASHRESNQVTTGFTKCTRVLTLLGTSTLSSQQQAKKLADEYGVTELIVPGSMLAVGRNHSQWAAWEERIRALLGNCDVLMRIGDDANFSKPMPCLSQKLANLVSPHVAGVDAFVLTGGATARAMLDALRVKGLEVRGEIEPGVVLSQTFGSHQLSVVTKAGAFGYEGTLLDTYRWLKGDPHYRLLA